MLLKSFEKFNVYLNVISQKKISSNNEEKHHGWYKELDES